MQITPKAQMIINITSVLLILLGSAVQVSWGEYKQIWCQIKHFSNEHGYCYNGEYHLRYEKPIIYLYPEKEQEVSVVVGYPERLSHTYPKYVDGWHVNALPNGTLTDLKTNRQLYALYWEGKHIAPFIPSTGFIVKGPDTISFLESKLAQLGLNEREAEEFIVYWLPQLESNPYNYIHFATLEEQNHNMPLLITPKPDTLIRVLMVWKPLTTKINIPQQVLPETPQRNGFTVVEWGGTEIGKGLIQ